eukprot:scaffold162686_cov57-Attheya_sp.AAC.3
MIPCIRDEGFCHGHFDVLYVSRGGHSVPSMRDNCSKSEGTSYGIKKIEFHPSLNRAPINMGSVVHVSATYGASSGSAGGRGESALQYSTSHIAASGTVKNFAMVWQNKDGATYLKKNKEVAVDMLTVLDSIWHRIQRELQMNLNLQNLHEAMTPHAVDGDESVE